MLLSMIKNFFQPRPAPPRLTLVSELPPAPTLKLKRVFVVHQRGIAMGAGWSVTEARTDAQSRARDFNGMGEPEAHAWALTLPVFELWIVPSQIHTSRMLLGLETGDLLRCA